MHAYKQYKTNKGRECQQAQPSRNLDINKVESHDRILKEHKANALGYGTITYSQILK